MPTKALFIGHSLVGTLMPEMLNGMLDRSGIDGEVDYQVIIGSPLQYNWNNGATAQGVNARAVLPSGEYDVVVVSEALPLQTHLEWSNTHQIALNYYNLAIQSNPATRFYVLETWHDIGNEAAWRAQIDSDLPLWQGIAGHINANRLPGQPEAQIIPAGQGMAALYDAIAAGQVPGATSIRDFFSDNIHLNDAGTYYMSLVQFAAVTGLSPVGIPSDLRDIYGNAYDGITSELAASLQEIAWSAMSGFEQETGWAPADDDAAMDDDFDFPTDPAASLAPALGYNLAGIAEWSTQLPFLDHMKTASSWIGHEPGQWGGMDIQDLRAAGALDANGWPLFLPAGIEAIGLVLLVDMPADAISLAGRYRVTFDGEGDIYVGYGATNVTYGAGEIWFDFAPGQGPVGIEILATSPGDHIRNISVVHERDIPAHEDGQVFNPQWLGVIEDSAVLRFMDWMNTNNSTLSNWADRPMVDDFSYVENGAPLEIMVQLANATGAHPWFTIPHEASDAYIRSFAEYVRDNLDPNLRAHFEFSNEVWNWQFEQAQWADDGAMARWGDHPDGWMQFYGMRSAQMAQILDDVYQGQEDQLFKILSTHTAWRGLEDPALNAPLWVAEDPENNLPPYSYFDGYAVTGYFDGGLGREKAAAVHDWLAESLSQAEDAADLLGLTGDARDEYIAEHRFDFAVTQAVEELRDGSTTGQPDGSLQELMGLFEYHAHVAQEHGLQLVMYEGGTHIVGVGENLFDDDLAEFFMHLNYTDEMGELYSELLDGWIESGGTLFSAYVDVAPPSQWGSWGAMRHLDDQNARIESLELFAESFPRDDYTASLSGITGSRASVGGRDVTDEERDAAGNGRDDDDRRDDDDDDRDGNGVGGHNPACFVATAAYGDAMHPDVVFLRWVRDEHLRRSGAGRAFVSTYNILGPLAAPVVRRNPRLSAVSRHALGALVRHVKARLDARNGETHDDQGRKAG